jgi:MOSC domain-containing protein YiiM
VKPIVVSVNISTEKGVPKREVDGIRLIEGHGIEGDAHAGAWHRQVSLLAEESINRMRAKGLTELAHGAFGENINTIGIDLNHLPVGTRLLVGEAILEVTQIGKECHNGGCAIKEATGECVMPTDGIFAIVMRGGVVRAGDGIEIERQ